MAYGQSVKLIIKCNGTDIATATLYWNDNGRSLTVPANESFDERTIVLGYNDLSGKWVTLAELPQKKALAPLKVGDVYGGGVVYWVNSSNAEDFRIVALDQKSEMKWSASKVYILGSEANDQSARNGSDIMTLAREYSSNIATGNFATDFPAFNYCYEKTDGNVAKGTWYLPSSQELLDLYRAKSAIASMIRTSNGDELTDHYYQSSTEDSDQERMVSIAMWAGVTQSHPKDAVGDVRTRCVRK